MAKVKIKDCTFEDFSKWCNTRACDGAWNLNDAMTGAAICTKVYETKPIFFRKKARQKKWESLRDDFLNLEMEIEV